MDHYKLSYSWEQKIVQICRLFVIDDTMDRPHCCSVLLDQNFRISYENCYKDLVPESCRLLLGPGYSLLKPEFSRKMEPKKFRNLNEEVLVFFGGSDTTGELVKFYQAVSNCESSLRFKLVAPASHQHLDKMKKFKSTPTCEVLLAPDNWIDLIQNCDFYFGSSGSVTWERFYFGLPGALVVIADNQIQIAEELQRAGLQYYFGKKEGLDYGRCVLDLEKIIQDKPALIVMSEKAQQLVQPISEKVIREIFN